MQNLASRTRATAHRFLRWSEKYTKTDMVFISTTGWWASIAQIATALSSFGLALLVARFVTKTEYGQYVYILSLVSTLSIFSLTGIGGAVMQSVARGYDESLNDGFRLNMKWGVGVAIATLLLSTYYLINGNTVLSIAIFIAGMTTPLRTSFNLYSLYLNGKKDTMRSSIYVNGIGNVVPMLFVAFAVIFLPTATYLVIFYAIGNLLTSAYLYKQTLKIHPITSHEHDPGLKRYGLHLSVANILNTAAGNLDNLLLFHYLGAVEVAIYNFAIALPNQTKEPLGAIGSMMTARFSEHSAKTIKESMRNKILWLTAGYVVIVAALLLIIPIFFHIFFPTYNSSIPYAQLYTLSLLVGGVIMPTSAYLSAHKRIKEQYINTIAISSFQIVSLFIGILTFGILGVIIARIATRVASAILSYVLYQYACTHPIES